MEIFNPREFRIRPGQVPGGEIREILLDQSGLALSWMERFEENRDEAIHEMRKCGKRIRGVLRLAEPGFSEGDFGAVDALARGYAKWFSDARDAFVLLETCQMLKESNPGIDLSTIQERLEELHRLNLSDENMTPAVSGASRQLRMFRLMMESIPTDNLTAANLEEGRALLYAKGAEEYHIAKQSRSEEDCHRWRKRAKYLSFHDELLGNQGAEKFAGLGSLLGSHHDLAVFAEHTESPELKEVIARKQSQLEEEAFTLGKELFGQGK